MSVHYSGSDSGVVKTKTSPGSSFQYGGPDVNWCCHDEYFIITNNDQPYMDIRDRKVVQLRNEHRSCSVRMFVEHVRVSHPNIYYEIIREYLRCKNILDSDSNFQLFIENSPFNVD